MKKLIIAIAAVAAFTSCTENERVKQWGGTGNLEIPSNQKFVNVTWKETELWVVTRDRKAADTTYETYRFQEESNWGVMEGTYVITELKKK
jgi:hypothetical protein